MSLFLKEADKPEYKKETDIVDWENPPKIADLRKNITDAYSCYSNHMSCVDRWRKNYKGHIEAKIPKGKSKVQPKLIRRQAEWRYAHLSEPFLSSSDMFSGTGVSGVESESAYYNTKILNTQFNKDINKVMFIDSYVRSCVDDGTAIVKVSWETDYQIVETIEDIPVFASEEETVSILRQSIQAGQLTEEQAQQMLQAGYKVQKGVNENVHKKKKEVINRPCLDVLDIKDVIIDPSCNGDIDKAMFIAHRFKTSKSNLKKDGRYVNLEYLENITDDSDSIAGFEDNNNGFKFDDKARQKVTVYEYWGYWDIDNSGIVSPFVMCFVNDILIRLDKTPFPHNKLPFVVVPYLYTKGSVYGEPDGELLEDNQKIIGAITRGIIDTVGKNAAGQTAIRQDAFLDIANRLKFERGEDFLITPLVNPREAIHTMTFTDVPRSAYDILMLQNNEAESMSGIKAFHSGISGDALGQSVGNGRTAMDSSARREMGILRRLAYGIIQIGKMVMAMNAVWLSDDEVSKILDKDPNLIKRDTLNADFNLTLSISTPEIEEQKASEIAFMLQTLGNTLPFDITKTIMIEMFRLRKMFKLADMLEAYQPQPSENDQILAQLTIQKLQAEIENLTQKAAENSVDVQYKTARTQTELAKAKNIKSEADLKDLTFVEKNDLFQKNKHKNKESIDGNQQGNNQTWQRTGGDINRKT